MYLPAFGHDKVVDRTVRHEEGQEVAEAVDGSSKELRTTEGITAAYNRKLEPLNPKPFDPYAG